MLAAILALLTIPFDLQDPPKPNNDGDDDVPDEEEQPIAHFLWINTVAGKNPNSVHRYKRYLRRFEDYVGDVHEADKNLCLAYINHRKQDVKDGVVQEACQIIRKMYRVLDTFDQNPMKAAMERAQFDTDNSPTDYPNWTLDEIREFVQQITRPRNLSIIMLLMKTGIRRTELTNLDLRDVHLDNHVAEVLDWEVRPEIENHPNCIYVPSDISGGDTVNGEERHHLQGNKRSRGDGTKIPLDDEMASILTLWIAVRPPSRVAGNPLFTTDNPTGGRLSPSSIQNIVVKEGKEYGWWKHGRSRSDNFTAQYCRHVFTHHMKERIGPSFCAYLRGDSQESSAIPVMESMGLDDKLSQEDYKHPEWEYPKVKIAYRNAIFKLL